MNTFIKDIIFKFDNLIPLVLRVNFLNDNILIFGYDKEKLCSRIEIVSFSLYRDEMLKSLKNENFLKLEEAVSDDWISNSRLFLLEEELNDFDISLSFSEIKEVMIFLKIKKK